MFRPTNIYLTLAICIQIVFASGYNVLYLMEFENTSAVKEVDYLKHALPDIIKNNINNINDQILIEYAGDIEPYLGIEQNQNERSIILLGKFFLNESALNIITETYEIENWNRLSIDSFTCNINDGNCIESKMIDYSNILVQYLFSSDEYNNTVATNADDGFVDSNSTLDELNKIIGNFIVEVDLNHSLDKMHIDGSQYGTRYYKSIDEKTKKEFVENTKQNNTDKLMGYIDGILLNPYDVAIDDISFDYNEYNNDYVNIIVPVTYTIKKSLIEDILTTLPHTTKSSKNGKLLIRFSNDDFIFSNIIKDRFSLSKYQVLPVLFLSNEIGKINYVYLDSKDEKNSVLNLNSGVSVEQSNEFFPLIAITPGKKNLVVNLDMTTLTIDYKFKINLDQIEDYSKVAIKFLFENEIDEIINSFER